MNARASVAGSGSGSERLEIRLAGSGGQGLILGARILFEALSIEGRRASQSQNYEPTSRGGFCHSDVVVSEDVSDFPLVTGLDVLIALDQVGFDRSIGLIKPGAMVIVDQRVATPSDADWRLHRLPIGERAVASGNPRAANMVALGAFAALSGFFRETSLDEAIRRETPEKFAAANLSAARAGLRFGETVTA
ncbi:2-oxoglutarate oxidoreductase, gamma subunit [Rhodovulum sp. PH10]|uniref:2-oxoacid:acceptor oxidoreductase family protein n=1 Tax=Rhodovulum sp. PH10 TaxID=1187851 RepID=UPI00027C26FF|nr:2-oxoacid:acceptor oxidoreductase family protein [Rhodovulum sp. PH10]EJW13740.1 2-oxoglutarate oxidoreductase, gamma subunit [Rhodovulum sp. PH10]